MDKAEPRRAFLFPGQAAQYPGMGRWLKSYPEADACLQEADLVLGTDLTGLILEGPPERLTRTENAQPAILAVSVATYRLLESRGLRPDWLAGHSLGEYSALVAAGVLGYEQALGLVRLRGRLMQETCPPGTGTMMALVGADPYTVEWNARRARSTVGMVEIAGLNAPGVVVVSGERGAVEAVARLMEGRGEARAVPLDVSVPFHSCLLAGMIDRWSEEVESLHLSTPTVPVVLNVSAEQCTDVGQIRKAMLQQVLLPIRWEESLRRLLALGMQEAVQVGPGRALLSHLRRLRRRFPMRSTDGPGEIEDWLGKAK